MPSKKSDGSPKGAPRGAASFSDRAAKIKAAAPKASKLPLIVGLVVGAVIVGAIIAAVIIGSRASQPSGPDGAPRGATAGNGGIDISPAAPDAAPALELYEEYNCPACADMTARFGPAIHEMATEGKIRVIYHMIAFESHGPGSKRAGNAAACAADAGRFEPYHEALMQQQSPLGQAGHPEAALQGLAATAGIAGPDKEKFDSCVKRERFQKYVADVGDEAARRGVTATPTLFIAGSKVELTELRAQNVTDAASFKAFVYRKAGIASAPSASAPAPSPTTRR